MPPITWVLKSISIISTKATATATEDAILNQILWSNLINLLVTKATGIAIFKPIKNITNKGMPRPSQSLTNVFKIMDNETGISIELNQTIFEKVVIGTANIVITRAVNNMANR